MEVDCPESPSKRVKLTHYSLDGAVEDESVSETIPKPVITKEEVPTTEHTIDALKLHKEAEVGITEYVSPDLQGFNGILKKRYTDFLVNEILPSGQVVHLDNLKAPKHGKKQEKSTQTETASSGPTNSSIDDRTRVEPALEPANGVAHVLRECSSPTTKPQAELAAGISASEPIPRLDDENRPLQDSNVSTKHAEPPKELVSCDNLAQSIQTSQSAVYPPVSDNVIAPIEQSTAKPTLDESLLHPTEEPQSMDGPSVAESTLANPIVEPSTVQVISGSKSTSNEENQDPAIEKNPGSMTKPSLTSEAKAEALAKWDSFTKKIIPDVKISAEDLDLLHTFFDDETVKSVVDLYTRMAQNPFRKAQLHDTVTSKPVTDKDIRTKIHQSIRRIFSSRLESYTEDDGAMSISAAAGTSNWGLGQNNDAQNSGRQNHRGQQNQRGHQNQRGRQNQTMKKLEWKDLGGDYLHFTVYKENKDTMEVVSYLAHQLNVRPKDFQFAGTKDRRAVTVQRVSVYHVHADKVERTGRTLRNARVGNYEYQPWGLKLGDLMGNEFTITLRDCHFEDTIMANSENRIEAVNKSVQAAVEHFNRGGFINYYGLQRFGTFSTRTDTIGIKMLQGDFKGATDSILEYDPVSLDAVQDPHARLDRISSDDRARAESLHLYKTTGKSRQALEILPRKFSAESSILRYLGGRASSTNYLGALESIPRNLRLMYVHAYQSLVWNMAASERWKRGKDRVLPGDLVLVKEHSEDKETEDAEEFDAEGEPIIKPAPEDSATDLEDRFERARALSQEEADSSKYSIFDIVLPTPGFDILYPPNETGDFYKEFMASDAGGGLDLNDMRRPWKDISLSGSYRKLLVKPIQQVSFDAHEYENDDEQFVKTDGDLLEEQKKANQAEHSVKRNGPTNQSQTPADLQPLEDTKIAVNNQSIDGIIMTEEQSVKDSLPRMENHLPPHAQSAEAETLGNESTDDIKMSELASVTAKKIAIIIKMQLGSSQYATMALRELMKQGGVKEYKPDFGGGR